MGHLPPIFHNDKPVVQWMYSEHWILSKGLNMLVFHTWLFTPYQMQFRRKHVMKLPGQMPRILLSCCSYKHMASIPPLSIPAYCWQGYRELEPILPIGWKVWYTSPALGYKWTNNHSWVIQYAYVLVVKVQPTVPPRQPCQLMQAARVDCIAL